MEVELPASALFVLVQQFRGTMEGLREVHEVIVPHAASLDRERLSPEGMADLAKLPQRERETLVRLFEVPPGEQADPGALTAEIPAAIDPDGGRRTPPERAGPSSRAAAGSEVPADDAGLAATASENPATEQDKEPATDAAEGHDELADFFDRHPGAVVELAEGVFRAAVGSRHKLIDSSLLTVAVAGFEALIAALRKAHYSLFPQALQTGEPEFSLAQLATFGDIADARDAAIDRRVDEFMRLGLNDWSRWLSKTLKVSLEDAAMDFATFSEVFQRRHIHVHNGGRVSRRYREALGLTGSAEPQLNEPLPVDDDYLRSALDELETAGAILGAFGWLKWAQADFDRHMARKFIVDQSLELLNAKRWAAARHFCDACRPVVGRASDEAVLSVNRWIAMQHLGEGQAVADEVSHWDTSALQARFHLAALTLLHETEPALDLLVQLLERGELTIEDADQWPLFAGLRDEPAYEELVGRFRG